MENNFMKTFEKKEGFSFVTPVTGLNRRNTGNEDDDDDDDDADKRNYCTLGFISI
jgi:hypothetical protein